MIARAYRVRTALLAASPAFQDASNPASWAEAANAAANVLNYNGGLSGLASDGVEYYSKEVVENLKEGINPKEIIWRENVSNSDAANAQEANNFPPSLNGNGNMNPSQNLVDAFPMANIQLRTLLTVNIIKITLIADVILVWQNISFIMEVRPE